MAIEANGLTVSGAQAYSGAPRRLTIWGGTITSIQGPVHAGSVNGNSTADFLVRFKSTGTAVLLAWGGHLAQSAYWDKANGGAPDGAAQVSGAPWHMRTLQLDGAGNKNQDRSIQPSAIVGELPPRPWRRDATPDRAPDAGRTAGDATPHRAPDPSRAAGDAAPTANPPGGGGGGGTGDPAIPAGPASTYPRLTPPATSTSDGLPAPASDGGVVAVAAMAMLRRPGRARRAATRGPPTPQRLSPHPPARPAAARPITAAAHRLPSPS